MRVPETKSGVLLRGNGLSPGGTQVRVLNNNIYIDTITFNNHLRGTVRLHWRRDQPSQGDLRPKGRERVGSSIDPSHSQLSRPITSGHFISWSAVYRSILCWAFWGVRALRQKPGMGPGIIFAGLAGTAKTTELHCQYEPFGAILVVGRLEIPLGAFQGVPGGGGSGRIRGMVLGIIFRGLGGDA